MSRTEGLLYRTARPRVLTALGLSTPHALTAIRVSLGRWTTAEQIDDACAHIAHTPRLRSP